MRRLARDRQRGVAAVEFGLVIILFCTLLFGLIEYGFWFTIDLASTNAVREGARVATTYAGGCAGGGIPAGQAAISNYITLAGLGALIPAGTANCVCVDVPGAGPPGTTNPQFTCTLNFVPPRLTNFPVPMPAAVNASAIMRGTP